MIGFYAFDRTFPIGMYKGRTVSDVLKHNQDYCRWFAYKVKPRNEQYDQVIAAIHAGLSQRPKRFIARESHARSATLVSPTPWNTTPQKVEKPMDREAAVALLARAKQLTEQLKAGVPEEQRPAVLAEADTVIREVNESAETLTNIDKSSCFVAAGLVMARSGVRSHIPRTSAAGSPVTPADVPNPQRVAEHLCTPLPTDCPAAVNETIASTKPESSTLPDNQEGIRRVQPPAVGQAVSAGA